MNWLNTETSLLHAREYVAATPIQRATWWNVLLWCAIEENGGRIRGAAALSDRQWQQMCGVTKREAHNAAPLLCWDGSDLVVWRYPTEKEAEVVAKRENARRAGMSGGRPPSKKPSPVIYDKPSSKPTMVTDTEPSSESGKEGERNISPQPPPEAGAEEGGSFAAAGQSAGPGTRAEVDRGLFETMAKLEGSQIGKLPPGSSGYRAIVRALAAIKEANGAVLTPDELERAAAVWRKLFPTASITARGLATHWAKLQGPAGVAAKPKAIIPDEPEFWRELLNEDYPDSKYSRGGEHEGTAWHDLPDHVRCLCIKDLPGWLIRTGRVAASAA